MSKILLGIVSFTLLSLSGCATNSKSQSTNVPVVYQGDSKVVIYRESGNNKKPITVFVQGRVASILMPNEYIELGNCARNLPISTRTDMNTDPKASIFAVNKGQTLYVRAIENNDGFGLEAIDTENAQKELKDNKFANHAVNRYVPDCVSGPTTTSEVIDLSSDVLFAFGKSTLSTEGVSVINKLAEDLKAKSVNLKKVFVEGYTDRIGSAQGNMRLSLARAQTVSNQLRAQGVTTMIEPRGMGSTQPVTTGCMGTRATPALVECLAPDRRVRIQLIGISNPNTTK